MVQQVEGIWCSHWFHYNSGILHFTPGKLSRETLEIEAFWKSQLQPLHIGQSFPREIVVKTQLYSG